MIRMDAPLPPHAQSGQTEPPRSANFKSSLAKIAAAGFILGCVGMVVSLLLPKPVYEGRLVGERGGIHIYAVPLAENEEKLVVWRGARQLPALPADPNNPIQQFDLSSADRPAAGTRHPDLVIDGWSGGMHCCLTRYIFDGPTGKFLGKLALGGSGASRFVPLQRSDPYQSAFLAYDDLTLDGQSALLGAPLAPILVVWSGSGFGLYQQALKATTPTSHAPFLLDPRFQEARLELDGTPEANESGVKGERAQALDREALARQKDMESARLDPQDATSFAPLVAYLNAYVYKGQAEAGFAAVREAHAATPEALGSALRSYAALLRKSQWLQDLNHLNEGRLIGLLDQIDQTPRAKQ